MTFSLLPVNDLGKQCRYMEFVCSQSQSIELIWQWLCVQRKQTNKTQSDENVLKGFGVVGCLTA